MNMLQRMKLNSLKKKIEKFIHLRDEGDNRASQKEIAAQKELGVLYQKLAFDRNVPNAKWLAQECFRAAAILGDNDACYDFGNAKLGEGIFWHDLSNSIFHAQIHKEYAKQAFEEAHSYLKQAVNLGHILAKRRLGLANIRGWGVAKNSELGTQMIIESIKEEGSWNRATQIFEELGLHSPEIFTELMKHK